MRYVYFVSHGKFASGLLSAVSMMTGPRDDAFAVELLEDMGADVFAENFEKAISIVKKEDEVILLADILSGAPFTNAVNILAEKGFIENALIVSGVNMPLAVSAVLLKDNFDDLKDLKPILANEGSEGLSFFNPNESAEESEEDI